MTAQYSPPGDAWYRSAAPKTGQTDDERIKDITVLPPPEHLIRFFPIQNTPVETLVTGTRQSIQRIMRNQDDRLLVIVGPCTIHNPSYDFNDALIPLGGTYWVRLAEAWLAPVAQRPTATASEASA